MARSTQLEQTEVFAAIERLLVAGVYPTAARVREQLDGRGSPVVLQRFLGNWYEQHGLSWPGKRRPRRRKARPMGCRRNSSD